MPDFDPHTTDHEILGRPSAADIIGVPNTGPRLSGECDAGDHDACPGVRRSLRADLADQPCGCPHHDP